VIDTRHVRGLAGRVWALACQIEPDTERVLHWWYNEALMIFDGLTPEEAIEMGYGSELERYLSRILIEG
jgi:hypothetical protein